MAGVSIESQDSFSSIGFARGNSVFWTISRLRVLLRVQPYVSLIVPIILSIPSLQRMIGTMRDTYGCTRSSTRRRLIVQKTELPLANPMDEKLSCDSMETPAIAESSHVPALLLIAFAMFLGYLFFRCVKARRRTARPLAYPVGLLG
jgi:hypothetical protein